jgi:hypothetical protein
MKALKSELAKQLLADPAARDQLRTYLAGHYKVAGALGDVKIEVRARNGQQPVVVVPMVVPKAA